MRRITRILFLLSFLVGIGTGFECVNKVYGQQIVENYARAQVIPSIIELEATPLHLYALSETEGLVVFRQSADSLQWLYSSSGMQRRGTVIDADVRFAYIYGNGRRLGVIEPTSVLGVYSSTTLPAVPLSVARTGQVLWVAMGESGLGKVSLLSPETVDEDIQLPFESIFNEHNVLQVKSEPSSTLFVLTESTPSTRWLYRFSVEDVDSLTLDQYWPLTTQNESSVISNIHLVNTVLYATNSDGEVFRVLLSENQELRLEYITSFGHEIDTMGEHLGKLFVRTRNGRLWVGNREEGFTLVRQDAEAGNYLAVSHHGVYLSQFDRITPLRLLEEGESKDQREVETKSTEQISTEGSGQNRSLTPVLSQIEDQILPLGATMIVGIGQENPLPADRIDFTLLSQISGAFIRGHSIYWKPASNQVGRTTFTILATSSSGVTDTTSFVAEVRAFNAPPLFAPSRVMSIPAGESFETEFRATDPDGEPATLIRYLGIDLPSGSKLNEQTGLFDWKPEIRQTGTHRFRIVATDQWGAAATLDVEIQVVEL